MYEHKLSKYNLPPPMNITNGSSSLRIFAKHVYGMKYENLSSNQQLELLDRIVNQRDCSIDTDQDRAGIIKDRISKLKMDFGTNYHENSDEFKDLNFLRDSN